MSVYCRNPEVFQGDPSGPPEYATDNGAECAQCLYLIDLDDERFTRMDDDTLLCEDCRYSCQGCGEWITDLKKCLWLRCYVTGRREAWHPACAATDWLQRMIEEVANAEKDRGLADRIWKLEEDTLNRHDIDVLHEAYSRLES
jgi:hypothetical protein